MVLPSSDQYASTVARKNANRHEPDQACKDLRRRYLVLVVETNEYKPKSYFRQVIVAEIRSHPEKVNDNGIFRRADRGQLQIILVLDGGAASSALRDRNIETQIVILKLIRRVLAVHIH